jgi:transcriptional regulator with XRE-family HTH domain
MVSNSAGTPRGRTLAALLKEAREKVGISARELSRRLDVAHTTVGRWENGLTVPEADDVSTLLSCLQVEGEDRERIMSLARGSVVDDWLTSGPSGISQQLAGVMECERTAKHITEWSPLVIPGVLQTSAYARAIMANTTLSPGTAEASVMLRMARRDAITRRDPIRLVALIGEPAVRGGIGGPDVMVDQLRHLLAMAKLDTVSIQIVSVANEWHPGHVGPFILYAFESGLPPILYLEHYQTGAFLVDEDHLKDYHAAVETIRGIGMNPADSIDLISEIITIKEAHS